MPMSTDSHWLPNNDDRPSLRYITGAEHEVCVRELGMESFELREDLQHYLVWTAADGGEGHVPQEPSGPGFLHVTYPAVELQTGGRYVAR
jgi:hypothetical protein